MAASVLHKGHKEREGEREEGRGRDERIRMNRWCGGVRATYLVVVVIP